MSTYKGVSKLRTRSGMVMVLLPHQLVACRTGPSTRTAKLEESEFLYYRTSHAPVSVQHRFCLQTILPVESLEKESIARLQVKSNRKRLPRQLK